MLHLKWLPTISQSVPWVMGVSHCGHRILCVPSLFPMLSKGASAYRKEMSSINFLLSLPTQIYILIFLFCASWNNTENKQETWKTKQETRKDEMHVRHFCVNRWISAEWHRWQLMVRPWWKVLYPHPRCFPTDCRNMLLTFTTCLDRVRQMVLETTFWGFLKVCTGVRLLHSVFYEWWIQQSARRYYISRSMCITSAHSLTSEKENVKKGIIFKDTEKKKVLTHTFKFSTCNKIQR